MRRLNYFKRISPQRRFCNTSPYPYQSDYLHTLQTRGFLYQCTDSEALDKLCREEKIKAYLGFDATASSLHVGSLVQIMMLRHLQRLGHQPIVLIGGGTSKIGDPSGKDESRVLMTNETIEKNCNSIINVFKKFLTFGNGPSDAIIVNNADWLDSLKYIEFLRDYGRYMSVNRMLTFESIKQRLNREQPLSFLEFNYMLLQAYDFVKLNETHHVTLQLGGSDQWGNIVCGVEMARKTTKTPLFGLTAPLIATSDGRKMGKSASGAVWLDKELLSEYDYWQFWRNTPDADVIRFLKLFTDIPVEKIDKEYSHLTGSQLNSIKVLLADEATAMLHGSECLTAIHQTVSSLYSSSSGSENLESLQVMSLSVTNLQLTEMSLQDLLFRLQITSSKAESRRSIEAGSIRVDGVKVIDPYLTLQALHEMLKVQGGDGMIRFKLSNGKKKHYIVEIGQI